MNPVTIQHAYRQLLSGLQGWHVNQNQRQGRWFFVPFSGSTGESGDSMLHFFRIANNLTQKKFHNLFIHRSEISTKNLTEEDTVVLIDDFSATGDQACTSWDQIFKELFIGSPRIFLFLVAATNDAIVRINQDTDMEVHCHRILLNRDNIFHADCPYYTQPEKNRILHYCRRADNVNPRGRGNKGLLVVFSHRCPNNTIPILHANHNNWSGLFPRFI